MAKTVRVEYTRRSGGQRTYVIEADLHGSVWIYLDGKVVKTMASNPGFGAPRWGSKQRQEEAIGYAQSVIEQLLTDEG